MNRPSLHIVCALLSLAGLLVVPWWLGGCGGCRRGVEVEEQGGSAHGLSGLVEVGAVAPSGGGPWTVGIALFDEEAFDPLGLEALDEPTQWETMRVQALPATFSLDHGASFRGWVVVALDDDGSGLPDGPNAGDLIGVYPEVVTTPAPDLRIYFGDVWER